MRPTATLAAATLAAIGICLGAGTASADPPVKPEQENEAWRSYLDNVEAALGTFDDIHVYQKTHDRWKLVTGKYIPVTVDGAKPESYSANMKVDRPMLLPPDILAPGTGEGGGVPYSVVGRMPGSNPEVQWVFLSRHYYVSDPGRLENTIPAEASHNDACNSFVCLNDVAVIGHHPRTGATAFFQFYHTEGRVYAPTIRSPWNPDGKTNWNTEGKGFWNDVTWVADINCAKCHSADPFIHSPWISQVKVDLMPGQTVPETMVPSNPLGPYFIIGAEVGGKNIFEEAIFDGEGKSEDEDEGKDANDPSWSQYLEHFADAENHCTTCHRIPVARSDFAEKVQLYARSTLGIGVGNGETHETGENLTKAYKTDKNQTEAYRALPWMPPVYSDDFYAGQKDEFCKTEKCKSAADAGHWEAVAEEIKAAYAKDYGEYAREINELTYGTEEQRKKLDAKLRPVPAPPEDERSIIVDRDHRDAIAPNRPKLVIDTRMRANTDTALARWRFHADPDANADLRATPVVLRRAGGAGFEILQLGESRGASSAGNWVAVSETGDVAIPQGAYMGLLLGNNGIETRDALVPYSQDDWAKPVNPRTDTSAASGIVTFVMELKEFPNLGDSFTPAPSDNGFRTYSFEFRSTD